MRKFFLRNQLCIPVKGYNRAIIYDILRKDYFFISKAHFYILDTDDFIDFNKIEDEEERQSLIDFLINEEIVFELADQNQKQCFTALNRKLEVPNKITNIVLHTNVDFSFFDCIKDEYILNLSIIAPQVDDNLFKVLKRIDTLEIDSVYLYIENFDHDALEDHRKRLSDHNLVFSVNFFNSKNSIEKTELYQNVYFNYFDEEFTVYKRKLTIDKLGINTEHFLEAYNFHSYYFGKVYIDSDGNIKNGLNNTLSFGQVKSISSVQFLNLISSDQFQELGNIQKDSMLVCCDCEFRYMCVDSRVPVKGIDKWYHPIECAYNPYLSKWDDEVDYLDLNHCGVTISASGCFIDKEQLSQKFNSIWSA